MTPQQKRLLDFIRAYIAEHEYAPTYRQMMERSGLNSLSSIHRIVGRLVEEGHLRKTTAGHRGLEVVDRGGQSAALIGVLAAAALKEHAMRDDPDEDPLIIFTEAEFRQFLVKHLGGR